ncbi:sulfotransferase [Granulosicoccus sp.]|nr:sulfotransferase [Granulosicoccus sp.]MDB4222420.1 sulfotransferase [Granulosicoccus sp.]
MPNKQSPVFVVGVPRSGTTVFSVKLAETSGIALAPETHFMPEVYAKLKGLDLRDGQAVNQAIAKFQSGRWAPALELESDEIKLAFSESSESDWPSLFAVILQLYAQKNGSERWGEKTPGHYLFVNELLDWYEDCRIIFLIRDPRAVVASNLHAPFAPSYAWFISRRWHHVWNIYQSVIDDPRVTMVRYEDFVTEPEPALAGVKEWLGMNGNLSATIPRRAEEGTTSQQGWRVQHLQIAARPVNTQSIERWREQLSPYDTWVTEQYAGDGMTKCGYVPTSKKSGHWKQWFKHLYIFSGQRSMLAITAAARIVEKGAKPSLKQQALLLVGSAVDSFSLLRARVKIQLRKPDGIQAVIYLGSKHGLRMSFLPLNSGGETLGLFIMALHDAGYRINLVALSEDQYFFAKKLVHAFGLSQKTIITYSPKVDLKHHDRVEICKRRQGNVVHTVERLNIDPTDATEAVERINRAIVNP